MFQGVAASTLWITALATLVETVGSSNIGKTLGIVGSVMKAGIFFGPMTGGFLLSSLGYWRAWIIVFALIALDLMMRLAMVDNPKVEGAPGKPSNSSDCFDSDERTPFLSACSENDSSPPPEKPLSNAEYYIFIFRQRRIASSMFLTVVLSIVYNSFNATLALHVQTVFNWGPRQTGALYLALVSPSLVLGPFAGWLRDSWGVRWPTIAGTAIAVPSYILLGLAGDEHYRCLQGNHGKGIVIGTLVMIGFAIVLTNGICTIEGTSMSSSYDVETACVY